MNAPLTDKKPAVRLEFIDALRGFACAWVVIFHLPMIGLLKHDELPFLFRAFCSNGWLGVDLFLTISGFCLALPFLRNPERLLVFGEWAKRRAWRILPAYLAALAISVVVTKTTNWVDIVLHATLFHNLFPATVVSINSPLWTMAMEWQLYFIAFAPLLYLLRRFGPLAVLIVAGIISLGVQVWYYATIGNPPGWSIQMTATYSLPLMLFAFASGMVAAWFSVRREEAIRLRVPLTLVGLGAIIYLFVSLQFSPLAVRYGFGNEQAIGLMFGCLLIFLYHWQRAEAISNTRTVQALAYFGMFSYSVYLVHHPVLFAVNRYPNLVPQFGFMAVPVVLVAIIAPSYLFYLLFEKPFIRQIR